MKLPNVTLLVICTICHELQCRAINKCLGLVEFGDVLCFGDQDIYPGTKIIEPLRSTEEYGRFLWYGVPWGEIKTSHVLLIQWDSWITDAKQWTDEFLKYDYVGAPWWYTDGRNVGNGGFSLQSVRLRHFLSVHRDDFPYREPQDDVVCREYRPRLEALLGIKWPSEDLARRFSFECVRVNQPTFGYHAIFNWPVVMSRVEFAEYCDLVEATAPHVVQRLRG